MRCFAGTDESQETYTDDTGDEKTIDLGEINIDEYKNTPVDKVKEDKNGDSIVNAKEDAEEKQVDGSEMNYLIKDQRYRKRQ